MGGFISLPKYNNYNWNTLSSWGAPAPSNSNSNVGLPQWTTSNPFSTTPSPTPAPINFGSSNPFTAGDDFGSLTNYGVESAVGGDGAYSAPAMQSAVSGPSAPAFGLNIPTFQLGIQGIGALASLYNAFQQNSIARDALNYTKKIGNANLANQIKSYNTNLNSQANMDAKVGGWTPEQTAAYVNSNQLTDPNGKK